MDKYLELEDVVRQLGVEAGLSWLEQQFTSEKKYAELFEILKLQCRQRVGLPLFSTPDSAAIDAQRQNALEQLMYQACGQVGELLFQDRKPAMAWKYFQLVGDRPRAAQLLRQVPVDEELLPELIGVAIDGEVDPQFGIELILEHQGTCNAITAFDRQVQYAAREVRIQTAELLVRHLHDELCQNLIAELKRQASPVPDEPLMLEGLMASHPWLAANGQPMIDVSHLASVTRIGRIVKNPQAIPLAIALCEYGKRLDPVFQIEGEFPFVEHFSDHGVFYIGMRGPDFESAIEHFEQRFRQSGAVVENQRLAAEVIVDLLVTHRQFDRALDWSLNTLRGQEGALGMAPGALDIARDGNRLARLIDWSRENDNAMLHAVTCLVAADQNAMKSRVEPN